MRSLKLSLKYARRTPYKSLSAVIIMTIIFLNVSIFSLLALGSHSVLTFLEKRPQITAFFKDDVGQEEIETLKQELFDSGLVEDVKLISKEEALAIYKERTKEEPILSEFVTPQILPASIDVSARKAQDLNKIAGTLEEKDIIEEVIFLREVVSDLIAWTQALRIGGIAIVTLLGIESVLIVLLLTASRIASRKEEIQIMQLLGATKFYISKPFLWEVSVYGAVGAFIASVSTLFLLLYFTPQLAQLLKGIPILPLSPIFMVVMVLVQIAAGILIGVLGSSIFLWRYLKA